MHYETSFFGEHAISVAYHDFPANETTSRPFTSVEVHIDGVVAVKIFMPFGYRMEQQP